MKNLIIAITIFAIGCSSESVTSLRLDVKYESSWNLEKLDFTIEDKHSNSDVFSDLLVLLPDNMAGRPVTVKMDGLRGGVAFAHGEVEVTPKAGEEVGATITLVAIPGLTCDPAKEDQCTDAPPPTCVSATTLRTSTAPGSCVDNLCQYDYVDMVCANGCADGACLCDKVTATMPADIKVTTVAADRTFRVNGAAMTDTTVNGYGALYLRNLATGDEISWGQTYTASAPVNIIPGYYDVFYELTTAGSGVGMAQTVPRNKRAKIATAVHIDAAMTLPIDLNVIKVDRTFKVNGSFVPDSTANGYGALYLRTPTGDEVSWGQTYSSTAPAAIIAGTYDVYYELTTAGTGAGGANLVPRNKRARIATAASLTTAMTMDLAVSSVKVDRVFTVNGMQVTNSTANGYGTLYIRNGAGDEISWGQTYSTTAPTAILPGNYDIYYEMTTAGSGTGGVVVVPRNTRARIATNMALNSTTPVALDVTAVRADRLFKVNGATVTDTTVNGYGQLYLRANGDEIAWGGTYTTSAVQIIAGTYDVYYELTTAGSGAGAATVVPRNKRAKIMSAVSITTATPLDLNVTAVKADRQFKVNGTMLTDTTVNGYGALYIRNAAGDEVAWGQTYTASAPVQIISGNYDVYYEVTTNGSGVGGAPLVPRNKRARIRTNIAINATAPIDLNVVAVKVDRTFKVNNSFVPDSTANGYGALSLKVGAVADDMSWGQTYSLSVPATVIAGTYDLYYDITTAGTGAGGAATVPRNKHAQLTCVDVAQ